MGLSSSQARLLNLTSRMHQIEYKAAKLEAEKLQMANESNRVYEDYLEALDKTKVQYKVLSTDGSITYRDIQDYDDLLNAGYAICYNGNVYSEEEFTGFTEHDFVTNQDKIVHITGIYTITEEDNNYGRFGIGIDNSPMPAGEVLYSSGTNYYYMYGGTFNEWPFRFDSNGNNGIGVQCFNPIYCTPYDKMCQDLLGSEPGNPPSDVSTVITNLINSGMVTLVSARTDGTFPTTKDADYHIYETSVSTNTGLQEVQDSSILKKAEAKYEADMLKIDRKDRKYDSDLAALDAERNAIKQEMDTLKTVAKENVERTFKLFS